MINDYQLIPKRSYVYQCSVGRERPWKQWIDVRHKDLLEVYGWKETRKNVLIIHGFNGTHSKHPMSYIRDGELMSFKLSFLCQKGYLDGESLSHISW